MRSVCQILINNIQTDQHRGGYLKSDTALPRPLHTHTLQKTHIQKQLVPVHQRLVLFHDKHHFTGNYLRYYGYDLVKPQSHK